MKRSTDAVILERTGQNASAAASASRAGAPSRIASRTSSSGPP